MKDGNKVNILFRHRLNGSGPLKWNLDIRPIKIAEAGRPLWVKHPTADLAALPIEVLEGVIKTALPVGLLARKQTLRGFYLGRDVFVLGFPFGTLGLSGFPIFRSAKIAPRVIDDQSSFALTFPIFPGDSGSPVYWIERNENGVFIVILGVVTSAMAVKTTSLQPEGRSVAAPIIIGVGYAAPATKLLETLQQLRKRHVKAHGPSN